MPNYDHPDYKLTFDEVLRESGWTEEQLLKLYKKHTHEHAPAPQFKTLFDPTDEELRRTCVTRDVLRRMGVPLGS
jgi:hypothetical protein